MTMVVTSFLTVDNKSNFPEVGELFLKIDFYLFGHCVTAVNNAKSCFVSGFPEILILPDFSKLPSRPTLADFPLILRTVKSNNPVVMVTLFLMEILLCVCAVYAIIAYQQRTRKAIRKVIIASVIYFLGSLTAFSASMKIYKDILPDVLNKRLTFTTGNNQEITGKPSEVGIKFSTAEGLQIIISTFLLSFFTVLVAIRWMFEGHVPETRRSRHFVQ